MVDFENLIGGIYRLKVPFEDIYTAVFLLCTENGSILIDSATTKEDAENYIIPALRRLGKKPTLALCTHSHGDHAGGMPYVLSHFEDVNAYAASEKLINERSFIEVKDGDELLPGVIAIALPGHSPDSIAIYDSESKTLITGDCVQLGGVGRYGTGIWCGSEYYKSLEKILEGEAENLIASHEYYPLGSLAMGRKALEEYISESRKIALYIGELARVHGAEEAAKIYNESEPKRPPISHRSAKALM